MKNGTILALLALLFSIPDPVLGEVRKHGAGIGYETAIVDSGFLPEALAFTGFSLFGKIGFTDNWGLLIAYRNMKDDEDLLLGEEDSYIEVGVHAIHMWRPDKRVRPHLKFGLAWVELEAKIPGVPAISDVGFGPSLGGGLEVGSQRVAFFGDLALAVVDLFDEDTIFGDLTLGVMFKF